MPRVAIAFGSNIGDRERYVHDAVDRLSSFVTALRLSRLFETEPIDMAGEQRKVINAAAVGETELPARPLLERMLAIEQDLGRARPHPGAARTVDLDLILYGDSIIDEPPTLIVPHPRFRERRFVLEPLADVAADWTDPVTGLTIARLLEDLADVERGYRSE
ncbi:MAG TPA: 2-amino-4-hydroxy-6-hydroxymethyldihydropteridine diphosphokinase [Vicinamibacterales bacterium]|nr:2-amino-4-hydroxy-6-hydroxymethyldihydropteridine diphosphokinase [Vicinamibacterales bacterium]